MDFIGKVRCIENAQSMIMGPFGASISFINNPFFKKNTVVHILFAVKGFFRTELLGTYGNLCA